MTDHPVEHLARTVATDAHTGQVEKAGQSKAGAAPVQREPPPRTCGEDKEATRTTPSSIPTGELADWWSRLTQVRARGEQGQHQTKRGTR